jgi:hypothetical protein
MFKKLALIAVAASLVLAPAMSANARGNGLGALALGVGLGVLVDRVVTPTQIVCTAPFWNGYQYVRQCQRVAVQPQPAPTTTSNGTPVTQACQAAMNSGDNDKVQQYCGN